MKLSSLEIDSAKIEAGAWVSRIPGLPGISLKVRGRQNTLSKAFRAKALEAIPRAERITGLSEAVSDKIDLDDLVENVLLDWSGFEDDAGAPLPFTKDLARRYLADPDYVILRGAIEYASGVVADIGAASLEADLGN